MRRPDKVVDGNTALKGLRNGGGGDGEGGSEYAIHLPTAV